MAVHHPFHDEFRRFANHMSHLLGAPATFVAAIALIVVWLFTYPLFGNVDTWQLVINTATTIITFAMVFLIQNTQNRDNKAVQLKLDELIRATKEARNKLLDLEDCTDEELEHLQHEFERLRKTREHHHHHPHPHPPKPEE